MPDTLPHPAEADFLLAAKEQAAMQEHAASAQLAGSVAVGAEAAGEGEGLQPSEQGLEIGNKHFTLYEIPEEDDSIKRAPYHFLGVSNGEGFSRLVRDGIDGLKDGESVTFIGISKYSLNHPQNLRTVTRHGGSFHVDHVPFIGKPADITDKQVSEDHPQPLTVSADEVGDFFEGLGTNEFYFNNYMGKLVEGGGKLGKTVEQLGFSPAEDLYPTPLSLQAGIHKLRENGIEIPNVHVFETGTIKGDDYVESWAAGEFPISGKLEWFAHDGVQDHMRGILVFGHEAMPIAQLYAQAVEASKTIIGRDYPSNHEINKEHPQKVEFELEGQKKIDHAAIVLDQFTSELDELIADIYRPVEDQEADIKEHRDFIGEMVAVIMDSPEHAKQLIKHFESTGSHAIKHGKFDYKTYLLELVASAQRYWEITPEIPEPEPKPSERIA